jgi:hypothetical protein
MSFLYNYNMNSISTAYQICSLIFNMIYNSSISSTRLSIPLSISIPYNSSSKKEELLTKDLDYFQMERLLKWMSLFFEQDEEEELDKKDDKEEKETIKDLENKEETKRAYKKELYNIYVGIKSDYKQYLNWKKYNNSIWILPSMRSKNTKDLSKKIISDIELFNEGLKMFSLFNKL